MSTLSLLQDSVYRRYWLSLLISSLGNWMQGASLSWLVLKLSGSAGALGWVVALQFLPSLLFSLPAGVLADRYSRRKLVWMTQLSMMSLSVAMAGLIWAGWIHYWHLLAFAFLHGTLVALDLPARQALVVELVSKARYPQAMSLNSFAFNLARLSGPALAGICIGLWGSGWAFWFNALTFVPLVWVLMLLPPFQHDLKQSKGGILEGLHYAAAHPLIRQLLLLLAWMSVFGINFSTLIPAYAKLELGLDAQGYGFLMSALGIGALIGSLWQVWSAGARPSRMLAAATGLAALHLLLYFSLPAWTVALIWAACGFCMVTLLINTNTSLQTLVPDALRGRVMAVYSLLLLGTAPLGAWICGQLFDHFGGHLTACIMGAITLSGLLPFLWRQTLPREVLVELQVETQA